MLAWLLSRQLGAPGLVLPVAADEVSALASQIAGIAPAWGLVGAPEEVAEGLARLGAGAGGVPGDSGPRGIGGAPVSRDSAARGYPAGGGDLEALFEILRTAGVPTAP